MSKIRYMREMKLDTMLLCQKEVIGRILYEEALRSLNEYVFQLILKKEMHFKRQEEEEFDLQLSGLPKRPGEKELQSLRPNLAELLQQEQ